MLTALLDEILAGGHLTSWFQPIVNLGTGDVVGYESLVRGPSDSPLHAPHTLFEVAARAGRLLELDLLCRQVHIRTFSQLELPGRLFLNVSPTTLLNPSFSPGVTKRFLRQQGLSPDRVVIELTEHHPIEDYEIFRAALKHYRAMGFAVAIDDLGAGYSGLRRWSELRPDYVKLDHHFIQGIQEDPTKRQFVYSMQEIATGLHCTTIAEGVETVEELQVLQTLEIPFGQGYHFARPSPSPPKELAGKLPRLHNGQSLTARRSETLAALVRTVPTIGPEVPCQMAGDLFVAWPNLMSLPVVEKTVPLGIVRRFDFMNLFASRYGRDLYGREPVSRFMDSHPLIIEKDLAVEEVSQLITREPLHGGEDFIITEKGVFAGIGTVLDLLRTITDLQIRNARHANPLTLLPGNVPINEHLEKLLRAGHLFTACYCDLDHFKPFNDTYGYSRGDMLLRLLAGILREESSAADFVGHIGGDDFLVVFSSDDWHQRCLAIFDRFAREVPTLYNAEHREAGGIWAEDRSGQRIFHPLVSLSIGAVRPRPGSLASCHEIAAMATEAKRQAKKVAGNFLFIERRGCLGENGQGEDDGDGQAVFVKI